MHDDERLEMQVGRLAEAVETLQREVMTLRTVVQDLTQARYGVKFLFSSMTFLVALGAGLAELVHWIRGTT